jgi:dienelactone hydrolase
MQAATIIDFLGEVTKRPDVDPKRILVIGQSHGGLTALALGAKGFSGVLGILNFAGGYRYTGDSCIWEKSLVEAFESFGKTTRIPSLWFYGDNDSYWGKELPKQLHTAYQAAGGNARLVSFGRFSGGDAHSMFSSSDGVAIWWPVTESFLREIGLPTDPRYVIETTPRPPKTGYAMLEDANAVPYLDERRRDLYRQFLSMPYPRAFSIAPTGNVGWAFQGHDPLSISLGNCERIAKMPCAIYAVDDDVVWQSDRGASNDLPQR